MAWIDFLILGYIALGAFRGLRSGLIRQAVGLASVLVGGVVASNLYTRLSENIDFLISDTTTRQLVAFGAIFAGFMVLGAIAGQLLRTLASMLLLGPLDSLGGLFFGLVQSSLVVAFILYALTAFPAIPLLTSQLQESKVAPYFIAQFPLLQSLLPEPFRKAIEGFQSGAIPPLPIPGRP